MNRAIWLVIGSLAAFMPRSPAVQAADVVVAPGSSLQAAIEACPRGGVIRLAEGVYPERITIDKPITLIGAGWQKTAIGPENTNLKTPRKPGEPQARDRSRRGAAAPVALLAPTLTVHGTRDVVLQGFRVRGPDSLVDEDSVSDEVLVVFEDTAAKMSECAVLGPSMNGIAIRGASDVRIERTLVAALWGTGVQVSSGKDKSSGVHPRAAIVECDIRNCSHRCVTIACDDVLVERCRISGSAWHGIRYDNCSPTIRANQIFLNARSGIYASGDCAAHVTGNVFWKNEMDGMSCWYKNGDTVEGNTFVGNSREGIALLGDSRVKLASNVFADNPIAVFAGKISDDHASGVIAAGEIAAGELSMSSNFFWANPIEYKIADQVLPLPAGNETADPGFVAPGSQDFSLRVDSLARRVHAGAADPIAFQSPFPIQLEEKAMIPDSDTRDWRMWKR